MSKKLFVLLFLAIPFAGLAQKAVLKPQQLLQDVKVLAADSMAGRRSGTEGNRMAQAYIVSRFKEIGLKEFKGTYEQPFKIDSKRVVVDKATNLIGYIPGKSDNVIVISAHYDHIGTNKGEVFNGADDNASGVGALLAAATYFRQHKPRHTLIFAAFDGEELGLQGANAFLESAPVPLQHILLNVNMDMLSINSKGELYASGTHHYPFLKPLLDKVAPRAKAKLVLGHDKPEQGHDDWTNQSDHYQFHKRQIPYVYFGVEDHPHYHKATDEFSNVNAAFYPDAAALVIDFIKLADAELDKRKQ
ncbi:M28 family peptidase [Pontibacter sp. SGAir0037]|uniref:M28 family peptidase n=1 Tax=Pontibacter sp. SGAir0037 TaxID=2571030 RepID=UPI0010CD3572|nr:M28 family peptidase [Pontibacter sp. SGAir0037]QCR22963.1 peptidase M20 [Pontibacter sp. SGAir0037]